MKKHSTVCSDVDSREIRKTEINPIIFIVSKDKMTIDQSFLNESSLSKLLSDDHGLNGDISSGELRSGRYAIRIRIGIMTFD